MERKKFEQLMGKDCSEKSILDYEFNMIAGKVIKNKRQQIGYSLKTLSDKMNNLVSMQAIARYEEGKARIKNNVFVSICYALNCEPIDVYTEIHTKYLDYIDKNMKDILKRIEDNKNGSL